MEQEDKLPNIDCIGDISSRELLKLTGFSDPLDRKSESLSLPQFHGKRIADFGAGVSDFLETIESASQPASLVAIDTMYENPEIFHAYIERTLGYMRERVTDIMSHAEDTDSEYYTRIVSSLHRRIELLLKAEFASKSRIERRTSIEDRRFVRFFDYIFLTNTFFYFKNKEELLAILGMMLQENGQIIITDYRPNPSGTGSGVEFLMQEIERGTEGFTLLGSNVFQSSFALTRQAAATPYIRLNQTT